MEVNLDFDSVFAMEKSREQPVRERLQMSAKRSARSTLIFKALLTQTTNLFQQHLVFSGAA